VSPNYIILKVPFFAIENNFFKHFLKNLPIGTIILAYNQFLSILTKLIKSSFKSKGFKAIQLYIYNRRERENSK
jgi:hypothetical protein